MTTGGRRPRTMLTDQRGLALPLALVVLTLLTSLTLAFLVLSSTEPTIAANLKRGEEALALAEAGIERAIWALSNPTIDTAGTGTKLSDLAQIPAAYGAGSGQSLFALGAGAYSVAVSGASPTVLVAHGYVLREGVASPATVGGLPSQNDIAAHRVIRLEVTTGAVVGGPGAGRTGSDVKLPGALTVAGTLQMSGNALVDGNNQAHNTPNSCAKKGGVTIRDKTQLADNQCQTPPCEADNSIVLTDPATQTIGTPAQQELGYTEFAPYSFSAAQLDGLKALAQQQGTYIKPTSNSQMTVTLVDGLIFVDTVNGQDLGTPPDASKLANVKITGGDNSGWLIVMGSITIDGNVTYNGFVYAHNDLSYRGTGGGGIFGGVLTGNVVDSVATVVDGDTSGNSKIYYDCAKVANGGGALSPTVQDGLNRVIVQITKGTWRELSN